MKETEIKEPKIQVSDIETLGIKNECLEDAEGFVRGRYYVADGISIVFRGREELPDIKSKTGEVVTTVLSEDEKPVQTSNEKYIAWVETITGVNTQITTHEQTSPREEIFIATSTPNGVIGAAIRLTELGIGSRNRAELEEFKEKVQSNLPEEEVYRLYDALYATSLSDEGSTVSPQSRQDGLIATTLWLAGVASAKEFVETRIGRVEQTDLELAEQNAHIDARMQAPRIRFPGEKLSGEEIELVRKAGLVAVHTSDYSPVVIPERSRRVVFPRGQYGLETPDYYPRSTIHWSLNHPVESHMFGDFSGRKITIISLFADMVEENGAPASLNGIDTYFSLNPGEGLILPIGTYIIDTNARKNGIFIELDGTKISLKESTVLPHDLKDLVIFLNECGLLDGVESGISENSAFTIEDLVSCLAEESGYLASMIEIGSLTMQEFKKQCSWQQIDEKDKQSFIFMREAGQQALQLIEKSKPINELLEHPYVLIKQILQAYTEISPENQAKFEKFGVVLKEAIRKFISRVVIAKLGGKNVKGGQHYVLDSEFQKKEQAINYKIGLSSGLHIYQPYAEFEKAFTTAERQARKGLGRDMHTGSTPKVEFDWTEFDSTDLWETLLRCSRTVRRTAIRSGMLTPSGKEETKERNIVTGPRVPEE